MVGIALFTWFSKCSGYTWAKISRSCFVWPSSWLLCEVSTDNFDVVLVKYERNISDNLCEESEGDELDGGGGGDDRIVALTLLERYLVLYELRE